MNAALSVLVLAGAVLLWVPPGVGRRDRLRSLLAAPGEGGRSWPTRRATGPPGTARRRVEAGLGGLAAFLVLGAGLPAALVGLGLAAGLDRLLRQSGAPPSEADSLARDLPVACDLLAVCLAAGTPVGAAVAAVGESVPGPLGDRLVEVGALYRLGAAPSRAWAGAPPPVDALARTVVRAGESGSAVVPALQRLAGDLRSAGRSRTEAAVQRAGVWVLAPLGLCFLPAFLCLGVVPMVLGIAGAVFG
ncbi:type II secretion system F family protein [Modestobacter sp. VKM Ac-2985]|uniref:type II secretion system F family protein n=1 Tax=Modestobacter sp. VKM Ac-2985 TaxID=3004139 RepID=UPI0022ABB566|nr:type II secretion system F family protein [Modestobacter sp. VKM Ac-2985]MCZ2836236.1 type II secretion system F family protein [Modestobacter sp. VKM Ac-2985]